MAWKKAGGDKSKFIRFKAGEAFEGVYMGYEERDNPFYDKNNPTSSETIIDYKIEVNKEEKVLSSTSKILQDQLKPLVVPSKVRIECLQRGVKKIYQLYTME